MLNHNHFQLVIPYIIWYIKHYSEQEKSFVPVYLLVYMERNINILMIGVTGHGKSTSGNFMLQQQVFLPYIYNLVVLIRHNQGQQAFRTTWNAFSRN